MAAAFNDELNPALATVLAGELTRAWPAFPGKRFLRGIAAALQPVGAHAPGRAVG